MNVFSVDENKLKQLIADVIDEKIQQGPTQPYSQGQTKTKET